MGVKQNGKIEDKKAHKYFFNFKILKDFFLIQFINFYFLRL